MTGRQLGALCAAVAAIALLPGRSLAKAPGAKKIEVKAIKAAPAAPHGPIGNAVGHQLMGEVMGHASLCAVVNAVRATPCASRVLAEKLIPQLLPLEIRNVAFRKKDTAELAKLAKDGRTEAPPPELAGLPEDMDLSLKILALELSPSAGLETVGISGKLHLEVKTPNNPAIKSTVANLKFTGLAHVVYAPDAAHCQKGAGGEAMRLYVSLVLATATVESLSTERSWWAKLFPGDKTVRWILNHLLGTASLVMQGVEAYTHLAALSDARRLPIAPLGFPICLGKKGGCGGSAPKKPPAGFLAATITIGKLGTIDFARAGAAKPFLELSSAGFLCHAFDALANLQQCVKPFADAVLGAVLPLTLAVPKQIVSAATKGGEAKSGSFSLVVKSIAVEAAQRPGPHIDVSAALKASLVDPGNPAHAPLEIGGKADLSLGAVCSGDGFFLWKQLSLASLETSAGIPPWLADGLGRSAVNSHLPAIELCLEHEEIAALGKSVDVCALGKKLLERKSTGVVADAALAALLPLNVEPRRFLKAGARPVLAKMFDGITISLTDARLATGKGPEALTASLAVSKAGQPDKLQAHAVVSLPLEAHCGSKRGLLRFTPHVTELSVAKVPTWLLQTTLLELANDKLRRSPQLICVQGPCKTQPAVAVHVPVAAAPTLDGRTSCSLEGGR